MKNYLNCFEHYFMQNLMIKIMIETSALPPSFPEIVKIFIHKIMSPKL